MDLTLDKKIIMAIQRLNNMNLPEVTTPFVMSPLFIRFICSGPFSTKTHFHTYYEVHLPISGSYFINGDKETRELDSTNFLLISPYVKHQFSCSDKCQRIGIGFYISPNEGNEYGEYLNKLFSKNDTFFGTQTKNMKRCFECIVAECRKPNFYTPYYISQMIMKMIVEMAICVEPNGKMFQYQTELKEDRRLTMAKQFISDNNHMNIISRDVANNVYISTKQLNRLFIANEGMTVQKYISSVKFKEARLLLCNTDIPVRQISNMLGFGSESYFNVFIKKHTTLAPGEFRRRFGNTPKQDTQT